MRAYLSDLGRKDRTQMLKSAHGRSQINRTGASREERKAAAYSRGFRYEIALVHTIGLSRIQIPRPKQLSLPKMLEGNHMGHLLSKGRTRFVFYRISMHTLR